MPIIKSHQSWLKQSIRLSLLLCLLLGCAVAALAADEITEYMGGIGFFKQLVFTLILFVVYFFIYGSALGVSLSYLKQYVGFDMETYTYITLVWAGGMAANYLAYRLTHGEQQMIAAAIAFLLIFSWTLFISTRSFVDITLSNAWRIALVVALVCTPYFGPKVFFQRSKPAAISSSFSQHVTVQEINSIS